MTFSPGPWTAHLHTGPMEGEAHINGAHHCTIAYVGFGTETVNHYVTGDEAKANARLIAAAPDLLKALKMFIPNGLPNEYVSKNSPIGKAYAAIAKAEGTK